MRARIQLLLGHGYFRSVPALSALVTPLALSGCSSAFSTDSVVGDQPDKSEEASRLSAVLLTLAQINGTVLAFVLGLSLLTYQLLAQRSLRRFPLGGLPIAVFVSYSLVGVVAPLAMALRPTTAATAAIVGASMLYIFVAPFLAVRAARSGLPRSVARESVRRAMRRRFRPSSEKAALVEAAGTLTVLRDGDTTAADRIELQRDLLSLCLRALTRNHVQEAARIAVACVGGPGPDAQGRIKQLDNWYRSNSSHLGKSEAVSRATWVALVDFCRVTSDDQGDLLSQAGLVAEAVVTSRIRHIMLASELYRFDDPWNLPPFRFSLTHFQNTSLSDWLREAADLALLLSERTAARRRDRFLFETICQLLEGPAAQMTMSDEMGSGPCFEAADKLFRACIKGAGRHFSDVDEEVRFRIERLADVPIRILEGAASHGYLASDETRRVYFGYLEWLELAAEEANLWVVNALESRLQRATRQKFLPMYAPGGRKAAAVSLAIVMGAAEVRLARLSRKLLTRWEGEGWSRTELYLMFDPASWLPDAQMDTVAAGLLPALDEELWPESLARVQEQPIRLAMFEHEDQVGEWFSTPMRADAYIRVLLSRWSRAWEEDYKRPLVMERHRRERQARLMEKAKSSSNDALKARLRKSSGRIPEEATDEQIRELELLRNALRACFAFAYSGSPDEVDAATSWKDAAKAWLRDSQGEDQVDLGALLNSVFPSAPPGLPGILSAGDVDGLSPEPGNRGLGGWGRFERAPSIAVRQYFILPEWEGSTHGYVVAAEEDHSCRLVTLEDRHGMCDDQVPLSRKYLPGLLLDDWIRDWVQCRACLGATKPYVGLAIMCPACDGSGKIPEYGALCDAVLEFILASPSIGVAPSYSQLPHAFAGGGKDHRGRLRSFDTAEFLKFLAEELGPLPAGEGEAPLSS